MADNYIKYGKNGVIFFDDSHVGQLKAAWYFATQASDTVSFFRPPFHAGPWDKANIVGHRSAGDIVSDMHVADHPVDAERLIAEKNHLDEAYLKAGRDHAPHTLVEVRND